MYTRVLYTILTCLRKRGYEDGSGTLNLPSVSHHPQQLNKRSAKTCSPHALTITNSNTFILHAPSKTQSSIMENFTITTALALLTQAAAAPLNSVRQNDFEAVVTFYGTVSNPLHSPNFGYSSNMWCRISKI